MEFQQLEMFAAVVEEASIQKAAERVYRTGPALTIALKKLEEEVGSPLFNKSYRNKYQLSPAGSLLYSYATRILGLRGEAISELRSLEACKTGVVRIGANESTSLYLLPKLAHAFQEQHAALKIEATCDNSEAIITALKDGRLDLALVALSSDEPLLSKYLIMRDEIVLITSPNHRLSQLPAISIKDILEEVLISESGKSSLREEVAHAFRSLGAEFDPAVTNVTIEGIKRMVAEGVGIGFVPSVCVHEEERRHELAVIRVEGISRRRELQLVHRKNKSLSPAAHAFLKVGLRCAREWTKSVRDTSSQHVSNKGSQLSPAGAASTRSYC